MSIFIPISLKKVGAGTQSSFDVIINGEIGKKLLDFEITSFIISKDKGKGIGSKIKTIAKWSSATTNTDVNTVPKVIGFDSSNTSRDINIDGEVEGDFSRHGKISFTSIKYILNGILHTYNLDAIHYQLSSFTDLKEDSDEVLINKINELDGNIRVNNLRSGLSVNVNVKSDLAGRELNTRNKLISKLQSLQILNIFFKLVQINPNGKIIADDMMTKIMRYALSIETDRFETPRYLRII
jgi:hypothetical protein